MFEPPPVWKMEEVAIDAARIDWMKARDEATGVSTPDTYRWSGEQYDLWEQHGILEGDRRPVPPLVPPITLTLPAPKGFDLDYFSWNGMWFCSARFRAALAQPPEVVQYLPVTVVSPEPRILAMEYRLMRVLASQPTIDIERSEAKFQIRQDRFVGGPVVRPEMDGGRERLLADLRPRTELFRAEESSLQTYATDALAARVMQAGCLGVEFCDPESRYWDTPRLIRTAKGVETESPATRRAHLRVVKRMRAIPPPPGV